MTNPTIDGVEVAAQADYLALKAELEALKAAPASVGPAGPPGAQGPKGDPGPAGKDGSQAPASIDDFLTALKALLLNGAVPAASGGAPAPADDKNPTSIFLNGAIQGEPLITSASGIVYAFVDPKTVPSGQVGAAISVGGVAQPGLYTELELGADGVVYLYGPATGMEWSTFERTDAPSSGGRLANPPTKISLAAAQAAANAPVVVPAAPPQTLTLTGATILFGDAQTYKTAQQAHDAANPGDTIAADPAMFGKTVAWTLTTTKPIKVDFGGRLANGGTENPTWTPGLMIDAAALNDPADYPHQLGGITPGADIEIWGLDATNFGKKEGGAGGTAAVRPYAPCNIKLRQFKIWKNQDGYGPESILHTLDMQDGLLLDNGLGDGQTHNAYIGDGCALATIGPRVTSIVTTGGGHAIKSRAWVTVFNAPVFGAAWDAACIDIPNGSAKPVVLGPGIAIVKKAGAPNHNVISYGTDGTQHGNAGIQGTGATFDLECENPQFVDGPMAFGATCKWLGNKPTGAGGVTGLPS